VIFWDNVDKSFECWTWKGTTLNGYGTFYDGKKSVFAHRQSYELIKGNIPDGLQLDHLCRNRLCVNPEHLEPVTCKENINRGNTGDNQRDKTHCPQGHPYSGENLRITSLGYRECRICSREKLRKFRSK